MSADSPAQRVVVFVDAQNVYKRARDAFWPDENPPHTCGQFNPLALAKLLAARGERKGPARILKQVRIHTGQPTPNKQPKAYAAQRKQLQRWVSEGCIVFPRPLRYPFNFPDEKPQEKGIDVALAIDFIAQAADGEYDVGILASTDTDLKPALEFVNRRYRDHCKIEVMAWARKHGSRLSIPGKNIWCHWLDLAAYESLADYTDYNL